LRLRFKVLFWSGIALFLLVTALASWGLFQLKSVMLDRRSANNMQMTLHSMLESLQEADIVFLLSKNDTEQEEHVKKVVALVTRAHQKAVALTKMDTPNEEIHREISELEVLIRSKVKTEDEYMVSNDQYEEPVVRKVTTMRDNLILTEVVQEKIGQVDHLLIDYQSKHLVYVDKYFDMNIGTISFGVLISFALFLLFANLVSREIDRRTKLEVELRRAQEAAITASALKSQFLATVSHEVRTPLNGIIGMSELIRNKAQGELHKYAGVIHDSGRSLLRIVNDILDFSRIEANRMELELQEVRLSSLFETAAELFTTPSLEKRVVLTAIYPQAFEHFFAADGARISQVMHNLVGNSLKFTSSGHVALSGEVLAVEGSEYKIRICVSDTGSGIQPEKTHVIFQPFEQGASEHQRGGTGLGLSISKRLVEMMGGSIHFTTQAGKGSKFWFDLPLRLLRASTLNRSFHPEIYALKVSPPIEAALHDYAKHLGVRFHHAHQLSAAPAKGMVCCTLESVKELSSEMQREALVIDFPQSQTPHAWRFLSLPLTFDRFLKSIDVKALPEERGATPSPSQALVPRGNGLILLVEDNATNQILAQTQLEQLGYRVHIAGNGVECLEFMQRTNFDLILMDCRMPVMDGFETTQTIRERERKRQSARIPIIAITANAVEGDRNRCLASGMDDYITKPIDLTALHQLILKWMVTGTGEIDWRVVSDLANRTNKEVVKRLIDSFQNTLGAALTRVDVSLEQKQWKEISSVAHQLKSSGAALGAVNLSHLCAQIEEDIDSRKKTEEALCEELLSVGRRVLEELAAQSRYT
jgi:two-component system, sensor histidine kinase and response regulator